MKATFAIFCLLPSTSFLLERSLCTKMKEFTPILRKHAYSNIFEILQPKKKNIQIKNSDVIHISAKNHRLWVLDNIVCGYSLEPHRRGGSNEYPQTMIFSKIRLIVYTLLSPSFSI